MIIFNEYDGCRFKLFFLPLVSQGRELLFKNTLREVLVMESGNIQVL